MAKQAYIGVNDEARKIRDIYIGVDGVAHKVVKGYIGINGVARQFWPKDTLTKVNITTSIYDTYSSGNIGKVDIQTNIYDTYSSGNIGKVNIQTSIRNYQQGEDMAQVDFSNAVLEPKSGQKPMTQNYNLYLTNSSYFYDSSGQSVNTSQNMSRLVNTPSKVTILYTGTFTASGTEFYMSDNWKVSNISFSAGDTYSFAIDIETTITI